MLGLIDAGLTPCPFMEGTYESRLEIIADIPAGKAVYAFERTDIFKAKEILGDRVCIKGNVPSSLLCTGTPEQVKEATRQVIEKLAPCGGLIIQDGNNIAPGSPVENINAMMEAAEEYGRH